MGRYVSFDNVNARYPMVSNVASGASVDSNFIVYAENEIDGLLRNYYTVPFSSNNQTVKDLAIDLTYIKAGNLTIEESEYMYERFMKRIMRLQNGEEAMVTDDGTSIATVGDTVWSNTKDYHPVFGMSHTMDFQIDSAQVQDEEADRGRV